MTDEKENILRKMMFVGREVYAGNYPKALCLVNEVLKGEIKDLLQDLRGILYSLVSQKKDIVMPGVLELLPNGQCQTNTLAIGENAKTFTLYLEADSNVAVSISGDDGANFSLFENNVAVLRELSSEVILKFEETSGKKANINAYCIMFN